MINLNEYIPTKLAQLVLKITIFTITLAWYFFDEILKLMPYSLEANKILTKLALVFGISTVGLLIMLISIIVNYNILKEEISESRINGFIKDPIKVKY